MAREECTVKKMIAVLVFPFIAAAVIPTHAQDSGKPGTAQASATQVPLRVQIVVSRYSGEKKISSVPYTLSVVANDGDKTSLRMGVDVPIPQAVFNAKEGFAAAPVTSYNYRSIGTNIDCAARSHDGGVYKLDLGVSDSTVFIPDKGSATPTMPGVPVIRAFTATFNVLLKDGQSATHTSATDPISGEVLRVDVTLSVLK